MILLYIVLTSGVKCAMKCFALLCRALVTMRRRFNYSLAYFHPLTVELKASEDLTVPSLLIPGHQLHC